MSEFQTARAFSVFEREVARRRRYVRTEKAEQFLRSVRSSCKSRLMNLSSGHKFWRAQVGHDMRPDEESGAELPTPFNRDRMTPLTDRAMEGRANPKGIPVLYLCTSKEAAMSEVRPWLGSLISLGLFETKRPLRLVDCSRGKKPDDLLFLREPPEEKRDAVVWSEIDKAFSKPSPEATTKANTLLRKFSRSCFSTKGTTVSRTEAPLVKVR